MFVAQVQEKPYGKFVRIGAQATREAAKDMADRAAPFHQARVFKTDKHGAVIRGTTKTWKG